MYYNGYETLSYNCLFNFVISNRGLGKTYWSKKWSIDDFLKTGKKFIYLRRYKQELKKISKFFDDIRSDEQYKNVDLEVKGNTFFINEKLAGYAMPLSTSKIEKSTSFPDVNKIIFDEFIIDKGVYRYLPDEVIYFLEFYETVARLRNDVRVVFLSNAISFINPYTIYFDLQKPQNKKGIIVKNKEILVHTPHSEEFANVKKNTRFGKIIDGTDYGNYAIDNNYYRDNNNFVIGKSPNHVRYFFTMKVKDNYLGVWRSDTDGVLWISTKFDPSCKIVYTTMIDDHTPNTLLLKGSKSILFDTFIRGFKMGCVWFDTIKTKAIVLEVIKNCL